MKVRVDDVVLGDGSASFVGDTVKVLPTKPGGRDGYLAVIRRVEQRRDGFEITVAALTPVRARDAVRTFPPARLRRPTAAEARTGGVQR